MSVELRAEESTFPSHSGSRYHDKQLRDRKERENRAADRAVRSSHRVQKRQAAAAAAGTSFGAVSPQKVIDYHEALRARYGEEEFSAQAPAEEKKFHPVSAIAACLIGAAAALYVTGAIYFSSHFYPGTRISGIDCGMKTVEEVTDEAVDQVLSYQLTVTGRNGASDVITSSDIDLIYKNNGSIEKTLKSQKSYLWPVYIFSPAQNAKIGTEYNTAKLDSALDGMSQMQLENEIEPQDAYLTVNEDGYYEIVPEVEGTTLYSRKVRQAVINALNLGETSLSLEDSGCYLAPGVRSTNADLVSEMNGKNKLMGAVLSYSIGDDEISVDVGEFIDQDSSGHYFLSEEKIWNYVAGLAEKYDTVGTERTFHTSLGSTVKLTDGDYGWEIDQAETAQELLEAVKEKAHRTLEPVYTQTAMSTAPDDIGDSYVEVSISQQTMWCYRDGVLVVETPVVTGNTSNGNATPSNGVWSIKSREENATLVGANYRCPVKYWMPFNGGVGIHDLNRSAYGGNIYQYAGSHGCINTPLAAVQQVFENVSVGTPVIVYD